MEYGQIQGLKRPVSRFVLGTAHDFFHDATRSKHGEEPGFDQALDKAFRLLDEVFALGVNTVDCSALYGEEVVGEWLRSRGIRDQVNVLTKGAHHNAWRKRVTPYDILHDAHNSLARMELDKIDIYLLHRDDESQPVGPIMETLNSLHREGKLDLIGVSNWRLPRLIEANDYAKSHGLLPFSVTSPHYSLAVQLCDLWGGGGQSLTGDAMREDRAWYAEQRMPIFAYSSLSLGFFSGRFRHDDPQKMREVLNAFALKGYVSDDNLERLRRTEQLAGEKKLPVSEIALSWLLHQPLNLYPVVSSSSAERMRSNLHAAQVELSDRELAYLNLERPDR